MADPTGSFANDASAYTSTSLVLFDPNLYQNRAMLPLPVGWTTSSKSLTSFTLFPKLPAEVRLMIWKLVPEARCVDVTYKPTNIYGLLNTWPAISSTTPPPPVLSVCRESRHEALKVYRNLFECTWSGHRIYLDPSIDTLLWTPECLSFPDSHPMMKPPEAIWEIMPAHHRSKIERLVVPCSTELGWGNRFKNEDGILRNDLIFCPSWSAAVWGGIHNRAPNFSLFWIFNFFPGLKELVVHWYARNWKISNKGTPRYNSEKDHKYVESLSKNDFDFLVTDAILYAERSIDSHKARNPTWNPPQIAIIEETFEYRGTEARPYFYSKRKEKQQTGQVQYYHPRPYL